jgi:hypothetical protein
MVRSRNASSFIPSARIKDVELFRLHGTMRVIRVDHDGGRLYLAAVLFMIGQFASVNFIKTGEVQPERSDQNPLSRGTQDWYKIKRSST